MRGSRDFWLLWGGSTMSNLGDGIRLAALPLLAARLTRDPLAISAVSAASFLPWILLSLVGGAVADRQDRRRLVVGGQLIRGVAVLAFAALVWNGSVGLVAIYLVALIIGAGEVVIDSAMQAAIPNVAGDDLDTANSRFAAAQFLAGEVAGAPIGGALFTVAASLPFVIDGATFLLGAVLIMAIQTPLQPETSEKPDASILEDIREGASFLRQQPVLLGMTIAVTLSNLADAAVTAILVLLVIDVLEASEFAFGVVLAVGALGGFGGSLASSRLSRRFGRRATVVGAFAVLGVANALIGLAPNVAFVALGSFVVLFAIGTFNVTTQSIRQRLTPNRLLGRVIATMRFIVFSAVPLGALGSGIVARSIGVRQTIVLTSIFGSAATLAMIVATRGHDLEGSDPNEVASPV